MPNQSKDKWEGRGKQAVGKAKEKAGKVAKDQELEAKGHADQMKARPKKSKARLRDGLGISKTRPVGNLSDTAGTALPQFQIA